MKKFSDIYARTLQQRLESHAEKNQLAVVWENEQGELKQLCYADMLEQSRRRATLLRGYFPQIGKGKQGEIRIGVWLPRNADFVISFLSIWFSGAVFVPISDTTLQRLQTNTTFKADFENRVKALDPHLDLIITDLSRITLLQTLTTVELLDVSTLLARQSELDRPVTAMIDTEAFIYCSSGTTDIPKVIVLSHEAIADRAHSVMTEMAVSDQDCILQYTGFDFDPSLMEIFMALQFGNPLIIAPESARLNPESLRSFFVTLTRERLPIPNIAILVPSMLKLIPPHTFPNLKSLMTTGENMVPKDLAIWFDQHLHLRIFTGYGPTETTWGATLTEISRDPICIHVTKPMKGIEITLLPAVEGIHEILVGGNGQGYYLGPRAEEQTQKNWMTYQGKPYFRPHDGVMMVDGKLFYAGRIDDLIKYHGQWVSLEVIDNIVETVFGIQHATTVNVSGSMVFIFVVLHSAQECNPDDLEQAFRVKTGGELFPIFFETKNLRFNARGKRCRQLKDYQDALPLTRPKDPVDTLSFLWTQALSESSPDEIQAAFATVGIANYLQYLRRYAAADDFVQLGGRSIKFARLLNLLWETYIHDPHRSQQTFKMGILRYSVFQSMSEFIRIYQIAKNAVTVDEPRSCPLYQCLWLNNLDDVHEADDEIFLECLEAEIKAVYPASFYHLIFAEWCATDLLLFTESRFKHFAKVDPSSERISTPGSVEQYIELQVIQAIITRTPHFEGLLPKSVQPPTEKISTLLGTACGKTSYLMQLHRQINQSNQIACYVSCRDLLAGQDNLPTLLGLSKSQWKLLRKGKKQFSTITWLIDDIEFGILDTRLADLQECLDECRGQQILVYCGRENFLPYAKKQSHRYGRVNYFRNTHQIDVFNWFENECKRSTLSKAEFTDQVILLLKAFKTRQIIKAETHPLWWNNVTVKLVSEHSAAPPLYLSQYPAFASLVRFTSWDETFTYSLKVENASALEAHFNLLNSRTLELPELLAYQQITGENRLASHIQYFQGAQHLSPWIFFHSISGVCPEAFAELAELILRETRQGSIFISMPTNREWSSCIEQVEDYLTEIEPLLPIDAHYYLVGWSYGGYLAIEAARVLERQRKKVEVVVNLDAAPFFAFPHFSWETHHKYIQDHLRLYRDASVLLMGMECNFKLLREYSQSAIPRVPLRAKSYLFQATQQPESARGIDFLAWRNDLPSAEIFACACDHFSIFSDPVFRTHFLTILRAHREQADPRPLQSRLEEKAQVFLNALRESAERNLVYIESDLEQRIHEEFLQAENGPKILIIEGEPGSGKSRMMEHLAGSLLDPTKARSWFPVIFPLRLYQHVRDINTLPELAGLQASDLKQPFPFLFIFDGIDEGQLDLRQYPLKIHHYSPKIRMIFTVRKGMLPHIPGSKAIWELPPLNDQQLKLWEQAFDLEEWESEKFFNTIQELEFGHTPLFLSMLLKLFHSGFGKELTSIARNFYNLYNFVDAALFYEYCDELPNAKEAFQIYKESFALQQSVLQGSVWDHSDPITQRFKKASQIINSHGQLVFIHQTWQDFHLVAALLNTVLQFGVVRQLSDLSWILTQMDIVDLPKTRFRIRLLMDAWRNYSFKNQDIIRKNLFSIVFLCRRYHNNAQIQHAARIAMELLSLFRVNLNGIEFSEIEIPGCDLSGTRLSLSRFNRADLRGVNFHQADLSLVQFQEARLDNIRLERAQRFAGNACCSAPDRSFLVVADGNQLSIYESAKFTLLWSQIVCHEEIRKVIVSAQHMVVAITDNDYLFLHYVMGTNPEVHWKGSLPIQDVTFHPNGEEIAIIAPGALLIQSLLDPYNFDLLPFELEPAEPHIFENARSPICSGYAISLITYSASGRKIAAISEDSLMFWDSASQQLIATFPLKNLISLLAHPSRDLLFCCSQQEKVYSFDFKTCSLLATADCTVQSRDVGGLVPQLQPMVLDVLRDQLIVWAAGRSEYEMHRIDLNNMHARPELLNSPVVRLKAIKLFPNRQLALITPAFIYLMDLDALHIERQFAIKDVMDVECDPFCRHIIARTSTCHPVFPMTVVPDANHEIHLLPYDSAPSLCQEVGSELSVELAKRIFPAKSWFVIQISHWFEAFKPYSRSFMEIGTGKIRLLAIRKDEKQMAIFQSSKWVANKVIIHDFATGSRELQFVHDGEPLAKKRLGDPGVVIDDLAYLPPHEKKLVALNNTKIVIWDIASGHAEQLEPGYTRDDYHRTILQITADGKFIGVRSRTELLIFSVARRLLHLTIPFGPASFCADLYTEPFQIFSCHPVKNQFLMVDRDTLVLVEPERPQAECIHRLSHPTEIIIDAKYRPQHGEIAVLTQSKQLFFWSSENYLFLRKGNFTKAYSELYYTPDGAYFALWGLKETTIEIWESETLQSVHTFPIKMSPLEPALEFCWLAAANKNANGETSYHCAFIDGAYTQVFEVVVKSRFELTVNLVWTPKRLRELIGETALDVSPIAPANSKIAAVDSTIKLPFLPLDLWFQISGFLNYRDYCHFLMALEIPPELCDKHKKRPRFEGEWRRLSPHVGEQLQRLGFFALPRAANLHQLKLSHVPLFSDTDTHQTVQICEADGTECGSVDVYMLADMIRIAKGPAL